MYVPVHSIEKCFVFEETVQINQVGSKRNLKNLMIDVSNVVNGLNSKLVMAEGKCYIKLSKLHREQPREKKIWKV